MTWYSVREWRARLLALLVLIALAFSLFLPAPVQAAGDIPDVVVTLSETSMTPQMEYTIDVLVTDAGGYTDIGSVVLKLYYDADTSTDITEFNTKTAGDAETLAYITWTKGGTFDLTEEADSTWSMGTCATPSGDNLANPFVFKVTPGKVSTESSAAGPCWQIAALVTDLESNTGFDADDERAAMAWYGEVIVNTASCAFGIQVPGTDFTAPVGSISMKYIANGDYDEKVKVATNAFTGGSGTVTVDVTDFDCVAANEVAFKADDDATLDGAVGITEAGATIDYSGDITLETGDTVATNSLWLKISSSFTAYQTKTGNIYFVIASGS